MIRAPLVVGYKGEIGRFILSGFLEHLPKANDIHCVDFNNSEEDVIERIQRADFIFLCVPLEKTIDWIDRYSPHLGDKTLVEQCSVKGFLYENPACEHLRILSMHLLFRPSATPPVDRRGLVFSDRVNPADLEVFRSEIAVALATPMSIVKAEGPDAAYVVHDRHMARQQALVHRVLLVLAESIDDPRMQTYVGLRVAELADRIRAGDPVLYRLIQENPFTNEEVASFFDRLQAFRIEE